MAARKTAAPKAPAVKTTGALPRLQDRLLLHSFLCRQFGLDDLQGLREKLRGDRQDYHEDGHSFYFHSLEGLDGVRVGRDKLAEYDLRIKGHLERLNRLRDTPLQLTYFQYLALLFTEIFLDRRAANSKGLLQELNGLVDAENAAHPTLRPAPLFADADLDKVAFWSATGSGKTILMHVNVWQHQHYAPPEKKGAGVLLITPNEGLSRQHLDQFRASGLRAERFGEGSGGLLAGTDPAVTVIEITKLTDKKQGGGQSVSVDEFEGYGLILVDEGHRGASGDEWRKLRARVAEGSLTMEYSATFGQIVNGATASKRADLLAEYSRAILFDFSYPHFYDDGFGKDYCIVNVDDETNAYNTLVMLGNLLSYYEQAWAFERYGEQFRPYNLDRPLWVFVGHSVTGGTKTRDDDESQADVEQIVAFFQDFLRRRDHWTERIGTAMREETGVSDSGGHDLFHNLFPLVKKQGMTPAQLYADILRLVFHAAPGQGLRAMEIKSVGGEIALQAGADAPYFAVINIGDVPGLKKLFEATEGLAVSEDVLTSSLFDRINADESPINVLIGSRKFMEGWDSFRVSSMGLMNIGRGEGSQIVQLFGRGVRLRGKGLSLKRTSALKLSGTPPHIGLLETLNIFGVRASYMAEFRKYLKEEGIETDFHEIEVPIQVEDGFLTRGLQTIRLPQTFDEVVVLRPDASITVNVDLRPRVESVQSARSTEVLEKADGLDRSARIKELVPLLNWERIAADLLTFKRLKELPSLCFTTASLREIALTGQYTVLCLKDQFKTASVRDLRAVEDMVITVLRKYVTMAYDRQRRDWERQHMQLVDLDAGDTNLAFGKYTVKIGVSHTAFADEVRALVEKATNLYTQDGQKLPRIHFDRHLYQPLLLGTSKKIEGIAPPGIVDSEIKFIGDLRTFIAANSALFVGRELFLLRNLTRGKGVGFFDAKGGEAFYPDFILWILEGKTQRIVFIDPHGIRNSAGLQDAKLRLFEQLSGPLQERLQAQTQDWTLRLDSYILAPAVYENMRRGSWVSGHTQEEMEASHVLFNLDPQHICKLFASVFGAAGPEVPA